MIIYLMFFEIFLLGWQCFPCWSEVLDSLPFASKLSKFDINDINLSCRFEIRIHPHLFSFSPYTQSSSSIKNSWLDLFQILLHTFFV